MLEDGHLVGEEPTKFDPPIEGDSDVRFGRALAWYNYYFTVADMRNAVEEYIKRHPSWFISNGLDLFEHVSDDDLPIGVCSTAEVLNNGNTLPETVLERFHRKVSYALERAKEYAAEKEKNKTYQPTHTIQQRTKLAAGKYIADLDMIVDMCIDDDTIDVYQFLTDRGVGGKVVGYVREYYCQIAIELAAAFNEEDPELVEGYRKIKKPRLLELIDLFNGIVDHCDRYMGNKAVVRKPRKKKAKTAAQHVKKVSYQERDDKLKIVSISPEQIIGSAQVWLFSTHKRTLTVLHATDETGLMIKGTTIINYNESTSACKILRKPEEVLIQVTQGGKVALRNLINNIRAKEKAVSGRLNDTTIILRALK